MTPPTTELLHEANKKFAATVSNHYPLEITHLHGLLDEGKITEHHFRLALVYLGALMMARMEVVGLQENIDWKDLLEHSVAAIGEIVQAMASTQEQESPKASA